MQRPNDDAPHLEWAQFYASLGWRVFPVRPGTKNRFYRYPDYKNPKNGIEYSWSYQATTDQKRVKRFWTDYPDADIGMATGDGSGGVVVIDVDTLNGHNVDGVGSMNAWQQEHEQLPATPLAISGSGSRHYFFKLDGAKNATGVIEGVDIRANGGYVILPPTADGRHWETPPGVAMLAPAAGAVIDLIEGRPDPIADDYDPFAGMRHARFILPDRIEAGKRTDTLVKYVGSLSGKGYEADEIRTAVIEANDQRCNPPLSDQELKAEVFPALSRDWKPKRAIPAVYSTEIVERLQELDAANEALYSWSDMGDSALFADIYSDTHRYCPEWKEWAYFDGRIWARDTANEKVRQSMKEFTDALVAYLPSCGLTGKTKEAYMRHIGKLQEYNKRDKVIKDAWDNMPLHAAELDTDPLMLNVQNGVLDLHGSPRLLEHSPAHKLARIAAVSYDPGACCPTWLKCLDEWLEGDADKIAFLQKFMGICLTGDTREETMTILYGPKGRNGKSVFVETFRKMLGDYADTIAPESLAIQKKDSRRASGDIAKLAGVRLVITSEPPRNMPLDAALVKAMLGRDTITARHLYQNEFSFVPAFKLVMNTNDLPSTSDDVLFTSGRVNVVLFNRHFSEDEQDKTLPNRLQDPAELAGILNWALEGLAAYRREGLTIPDSIRDANNQYRTDSDKIGLFIDACMLKDPTSKEKLSDTYDTFKNWCRKEGYSFPFGRITFNNELRRRGIETVKTRVNGSGPTLAIIGYRRIEHEEDQGMANLWLLQ